MQRAWRLMQQTGNSTRVMVERGEAAGPGRGSSPPVGLLPRLASFYGECGRHPQVFVAQHLTVEFGLAMELRNTRVLKGMVEY